MPGSELKDGVNGAEGLEEDQCSRKWSIFYDIEVSEPGRYPKGPGGGRLPKAKVICALKKGKMRTGEPRHLLARLLLSISGQHRLNLPESFVSH